MSRSMTLPAWVVTISLIATGCAAQPEPQQTAAAPVESPTPSPAPVENLPPQTLGGLTCEDILATDAVDALVPSARPLELFDSNGYFRLFSARIVQEGGFVCTWTNGLGREQTEDFSELTIVGLPDAAAEFEKLEKQATSSEQDLTPACRFESGYCDGSVLVDGSWWLEVSAKGPFATETDAATATSLSTLLGQVEKVLTDVDTSAEGWEIPPTAASISATCGELVTGEEVAEALDTDEKISLITSRDGGGIFFMGEALDERLDTTPCYWFGEGEESSDPGDISVTLGGAWAAKQLLGQVQAEAVDITGLEDGDLAYVHCLADRGCWLELAVGEHWVSVLINTRSPLVNDVGRDRFSKAIAETVVAKING